MVLVSALLVLLAREDELQSAYIGFFPVIFFWVLDGYFLWQARLFRDLYDHVRILNNDVIDFSMNTRISKQTWLSAVFSGTLVSFCLALALLLTGAMLVY